MPELEKRQAGAEVTSIEVTPEMMEAGVAEFLSYDSRDLADTPAQEVVRGILVAALGSASSSPLSG